MKGQKLRLASFVDVRPSELRAAIQAFVALFLVVAGHTILETARDALLLTRLAPRMFGALYVAAAASVLIMASFTTRIGERFGLRRTLTGSLVIAATVALGLFSVHTSIATILALYVASTLIGAVVVPQFWNLIGSTFTASQGRRLFGPIAAAGVIGGAAGSAAAATVLAVIHVKALLVMGAVPFALAAAVVSRTLVGEPAAPIAPVAPAMGPTGVAKAMKEEPFLRSVALLVVVSTAAMFTLDYFFKWTVARSVAHADVARFVARYYAVLNGIALVTQFALGGTIVRRMGVGSALVVTPFVLLSGAVGALATGGSLVAVLLLKGVDGAIRTPLHRVVTELLYLPMSARARSRAKPYIDGSLARLSQGAVGAILLALAGASFFSPRVMAAVVVAFAFAWLTVAITTRRAYFKLLRRAVSGGTMDVSSGIDALDFESAEALVESLADDDPLIVVGAMDALARRDRERLISSLILLHSDEDIVIRALTLFAASRREDWVKRARRLLTDPRDAVRMAAARALATHDRLDSADLAKDASPGVQGYAALHVALRASPDDVLDDPGVMLILTQPGDAGERARLGLLTAIADLPAGLPVTRLLLALEARAASSRVWVECLARAAASQHATNLLPMLISRLSRLDARETILSVLVSFGQPGVEAVWATLSDHSRERKLRVQLPGALARFGTAESAEMLLECIETERDGLVRFKAIRGLGRLVAERKISIDRVRVERLSLANLREYFRLLGLRAKFDLSPVDAAVGTASHASTERLLVGLLDDKLRQSLERCFRLLKIAHPREDIHRVHIACLSDDKRARANAGEFLDALLRRNDQRTLRELLLLVADDHPLAECLARAEPWLGRVAPKTRHDAVAEMLDDTDPAIADLASLHAAVTGEGGGSSAKRRATLPPHPGRMNVVAVAIESSRNLNAHD
jgi:AAA family ATP:ADP antiporter